MFARFDENPAMTLRVIKETKCYGRTHARTDNVKTVYPLQTKFAGGINIPIISMYLQAEPKTVHIKISWILRTQLIWFYTVSKQDISRV